jgi:hypothetical protein
MMATFCRHSAYRLAPEFARQMPGRRNVTTNAEFMARFSARLVDDILSLGCDSGNFWEAFEAGQERRFLQYLPADSYQKSVRKRSAP